MWNRELGLWGRASVAFPPKRLVPLAPPSPTLEVQLDSGSLGGPAGVLAISRAPCTPLLGSDDDRANLMWKRYLERDDSKIVGTW